jgi:DNA polymerase III epsilon subunit-like protein
MGLFVVDVEADGPAPGLYSMVSFGVVHVPEGKRLGEAFYAELAPISDRYMPEALAVSGFTRARHEALPPPERAMADFARWLETVNGSGSHASFVSDNPAFDFAFMNYYLWRYVGANPFGHSARRIGDFHAGLQRNFFARQDWRQLRRTRHSHNALDDARGNAEALIALIARSRALAAPHG